MKRTPVSRCTFAALAFVAASIATPLLAQDKPPGQPKLKLATRGSYQLDHAHSQVLFTVNHLGYTEYSGMFTDPAGALDLDPGQLSTSRVEVSFPIDHVKTTSTELDAKLKGDTFFDAAKFPTAHFVSTTIAGTAGAATVNGDLTIHGITKPVVLKARFIGAGPEFWGDKKMALGFAATTTIRRSDFGLGQGVPLVSDRVDLTINAGFEAR